MMIRLNRGAAAAAGAGLLLMTLAGCGGGGEPGEGAGGGGAAASSSAPSVLPASLFVETRPPNALPLTKAKPGLQKGDPIVFEARVGGQATGVFVDGRAVMMVADPALTSCDQISGDKCPTPWDYCCEDPAALKAGRASVQIVDASGSLLPASLKGEHGVDYSKTVVVEGTVAESGEGLFVVHATKIYVAPSGGDAED